MISSLSLAKDKVFLEFMKDVLLYLAFPEERFRFLVKNCSKWLVVSKYFVCADNDNYGFVKINIII